MNQQMIRSPKQSRRRILTRTQSSSFKNSTGVLNNFTTKYQLENNIYSKQNTYMTAGSQSSQQNYWKNSSKGRVRSVSSKSLFSAAKNRNSQFKLKIRNEKFVLPTSKQSTIDYESCQYNGKKNLHQIFNQKIDKKNELKVKELIQNYSSIRKIVNESNKLINNRLENNLNNNLQQRKENLERALDTKKFNQLVSQYVQTEQSQKSQQFKREKQKQSKKYKRKMVKTQAFSIEISINQMHTIKKSSKFLPQGGEVDKNLISQFKKKISHNENDRDRQAIKESQMKKSRQRQRQRSESYERKRKQQQFRLQKQKQKQIQRQIQAEKQRERQRQRQKQKQKQKRRLQKQKQEQQQRQMLKQKQRKAKIQKQQLKKRKQQQERMKIEAEKLQVQKQKQMQKQKQAQQQNKKQRQKQQQVKQLKPQNKKQTKKQPRKQKEIIQAPPALSNTNSRNKYSAEEQVELDSLQSVRLAPESTYKSPPKKQKMPEKQKQQEQKAISKPPTASQKQKQVKNQDNATVNLASKPSIKEETTCRLQQANKQIDVMTPVGQVAGYCAQLMKKSKLNWYTPAILLYKQCHKKFIQYEPIYIQAAKMQIIDNSQKQKYIEDNSTIQKNLQKIITMAKKKSKLTPQHQSMVTAKQNIEMAGIIQKQVINFAKSVLQTEEKDNYDTMMCLLRMLNGVKIIGWLKGKDVKFMSAEKLQQVKQTQIYVLVMNFLEQISLKRLKF